MLQSEVAKTKVAHDYNIDRLNSEITDLKAEIFLLKEREQAQDSELYAKRQEVSQLESNNNVLSEDIEKQHLSVQDLEEKLKEQTELVQYMEDKKKNEN